ncbi:hypothetical protein D1164_10385 [Mariniphaga sediminis]|uniref:Uncharacterized protein n=1 Tax=Mariniphaga sediminis TaxID=1628158 RepID=A0A399D2S1_9BACT|nr:hypothetical protein [Mariniphaga sediminis]RIH64991.1 hypothetical protein D1164_10385 [Mariniphaga sediminis]
MYSSLTEIFKILGIVSIGSFSIVGLCAFLFKKLFDYYLKEELARTQSNLQLKNEKLKIEIESTKQNKILAFKTLHEERALLIKDLYSKLYLLKVEYEKIKLQETSLSFEQLNSIEKECIEIQKVVGLNRLYLTKSISENLNELIKKFERTNEILKDLFSIGENTFSSMSEVSNYKPDQEEIEILHEKLISLISDIIELLDKLEESFKLLLNIE